MGFSQSKGYMNSWTIVSTLNGGSSFGEEENQYRSRTNQIENTCERKWVTLNGSRWMWKNKKKRSVNPFSEKKGVRAMKKWKCMCEENGIRKLRDRMINKV